MTVPLTKFVAWRGVKFGALLSWLFWLLVLWRVMQ